MNSDIKFSITKSDDEIRVSVEMGGNDLIMEVQISAKAFKTISVEGTDAKINIASSVIANSIAAKSENGNIDVTGTFQYLTIESMNGNVKVASNARCNVNLNVKSRNGNVDVTIGRIGASEVFVTSKNGKCKNNPKMNFIYSVSGCIKSKNGNVKFY